MPWEPDVPIGSTNEGDDSRKFVSKELLKHGYLQANTEVGILAGKYRYCFLLLTKEMFILDGWDIPKTSCCCTRPGSTNR